MHFKILLILSGLKSSLADLQADNSKTIQQKTKTLSRRRRYLAFPEGSSLQMIYDLTYPSVAAMGDLLQFGHTAVMAWKLPTEPIFMDKKRLAEVHNETKMEESMGKIPINEGNGEHFNSEWQVPMDSDQYNNFWTQNYQRSPDYGWNSGYYNRRNFDNTRNGPYMRYENFEKPDLYHVIHRRSRRDLYQKIEKLFTAFKKDGKACLLKAICQFTKFPDKKGSMIVEILKAIFKTRPYQNYPDQDHYDLAAKPEADCEKLFPTCNGSILSHIFVNKRKK